MLNIELRLTVSDLSPVLAELVELPSVSSGLFSSVNFNSRVQLKSYRLFFVNGLVSLMGMVVPML